MKYFLIAGEASGDLLGASLMQGILELDKNATFNYWGGENMLQKSPGLLQHYKDINIMGFVEVLLKLRTISKNLERCKQQLIAFNPHVVVFIDYPGFNLRIAAFAKEQGYKTAYFIAPKIWAWNEKRGYKLEKYIDRLMLIFPFEVSYFKKWKLQANYVGNPLVNMIRNFKADPGFRAMNSIDERPVIALLPGSRRQEIARTLPVMLKVAAQFSNYQFVIAGAPAIDIAYYKPFINEQVKIVYNQTYNLLSIACGAVVCSGTATLEVALFNVPQVCCYAANEISYQLAVRFVKVKYISLVNLNLDKPAICELIQHDMTVDNISNELKAALPGGSKHKQLMLDYNALQTLFGNENAGLNAAHIVTELARV